jgi:hypothetical protein
MSEDKDKSQTLADQLFPIKKETDELEILDIPPEQRRLHTETYDFTVATIFEYLSKGDIFIPEFQRSYVWNRAQASRFIESFVIQCPIPVIYLNQERDEKLSVIDGNQRLQSIKLFLEDGYALRGLTTYPELEGYTYSQLDSRIKRHILNRTLRCIAILKDTHPQIKFDVFERLNTGAAQLTPQEIRHGVYHGPLIEMIDDLVKDRVWKKLSGFSTDKRMKGGELIVRFIALSEDLQHYQKPLSSFLNRFCETKKNASAEELEEWKSKFRRTIKIADDLLGAYAFRTLDENGKPNKNLNAALYDAQMVGISSFNGKLPKMLQKTLIEQLHRLFREKKFYEAITAGTSATTFVKYRITRFTKFLQEL